LADAELLIALVEKALENADATIATGIGGQRTETKARLWRGQVLVDWEPDARAGDCLLRPDLLRRLIALRAEAASSPTMLTLKASGRIVSALSDEHAALVSRLGGARRVELTLRLGFAEGQYRGGTESYALVQQRQRLPLLELSAEVMPRAVSPRTSPAPR